MGLTTGRVPEEWETAVVILVLKKGGRSDVSNYRPISLLSATSKVLEKIVAAELSKHIAPVLPTNQSGFRKADGTESQLNRIVHTLQQGLDNSKTVLAVFYDLSKAFDRVWHEG